MPPPSKLATSPAISPNVTAKEMAGGNLPMKPTRKMRYLNRWIIAASEKYKAGRPRIDHRLVTQMLAAART